MSQPAAEQAASPEVRALTVPLRYAPGFKALATQTEPAFEALRGALEQADPSAYAATVARRVQAGHPDGHSVRPIVQALLSAEAVRQQQQLSPLDAARALADADGIDLPADSRGVLRDRLSQLLGARALDVSVRAGSMGEADAHLFLRATIVPTIRPILPEGDLAASVDTLVLHKLSIEFHDAPSHQDQVFLVALDRGDMVRLRDTLQRAIDASAKVSALLNRAGMVDVGEGSADD